MSGGFLERMAESSRRRSREARARISAGELARRIGQLPPPPRISFSPEGFDLIAEIKPRSPSEGELARGGYSPVRLARQYVSAGAAAISVLTEPGRFGGSLALLSEIAAALPQTPVMRKDFLVDSYQVREARLHGAAGVLLIVGITGGESTREMLQCALDCGMFALLEAFDEAELEQAQRIAESAGPRRDSVLLGLNCRDLRTLAVDRMRFMEVDPANRGGFRMLAESGIEKAGQAAELAARGWDGLLIGTALMRSPDPQALASGMLAQARRSKGARECS